MIPTSDSLVTAGVGVVVLLVGYLIKDRGWTFLIAGYDASVEADEEIVGDVVGSMLLRLGLAVLAFAGLLVVGAVTPLVEYVVAAAILLAVARTVYRVRSVAAG